MWEGSIEEGNFFHYYKKSTGKQFIAEATDLQNIKNSTYDFLLSSNCLEHIANPLKALDEWIRIIKPDGYFLLVLPKKESNFDHKRPNTTFEHLLEDYKNAISEHDLTHLDEILELHDLSRDPSAGNYKNFRARSLNNYSNRGLHHHVFDLDLIENIFKYYNVKLIQTNQTSSDYFALGQVKKY
jgi:ubiquinone/menaquinone biosynthesis C-methylase UbiE